MSAGGLVSAGPAISAAVCGRPPEPRAAELARQFPPRPALDSWPATTQPREEVLQRLLAPPFVLANRAGQRQRRRAVMRVLDWLEGQPGHTWQQRWAASGAEDTDRWRQLPVRWLTGTGGIDAGSRRPEGGLSGGTLLLICGDVIRPGVAWLLARSGLRDLTAEMARTRDRDALAALRRLCEAEATSPLTRDLSLRRIAAIVAAKGGTVADITVGDCLELSRLVSDLSRSLSKGMHFYQLLHTLHVFPAGAPATVRMFTTQGQPSVEQLVDRHQITCRPVRDLLVDYLREQQLTVDHGTLQRTAHVLASLFWHDLEHHHPGIDSLRLTPEIAAGWKQRILTKTRRSAPRAGEAAKALAPRSAAANALFTVRAFYLDIAQWAIDDPSRWACWVVPCPIRAGEVPYAKPEFRRW